MLIDSILSVGASNRPEVTADATCHADTLNSDRGHRDRIAHTAVMIAATASPTSDPVGSGITGTGSTATTKAVNPSRNGPARASNRRSQPRTVDAARSTSAATRRCPHPAPAATSAAPITSTPSARRSKQPTGSKMWVAPQPEHRPRRGRNRHRT